MPDGSRNWSDLTDDERTVYAARMQVNAGMLEAMDHHIGRLVAHLKQTGAYDNTIFVITSDNGPEHNRGDNDSRLATWMRFNGYHVDLEGVGERGSWGFIGPEWANAAASPGALFKFYMAEGGIRVPLIMSGPGIAPQRVDAMTLVSDVAPTLLDLTGTQVETADVLPMTGRSLMPLLTGEADRVYGADEPVGMEVSGNSELLADYAAYAQRVGVLEMPEGYDSGEQIEANTLAKLRKQYGWIVIVIGLIFLALLYGLWRLVRRFILKPRSA